MVDVDTLNRHLVTAHAGRVMLGGLVHILTPARACELAAWLVAMADVSSALTTGLDDFDADDHFKRALEAIRNT